MTGAELVDEVQALVGRTGDTALCDDTRCTRWLNEAQKEVVEKVPGIHNMVFKNTTSVDTTVVLSYALTDWTVGDATTQSPCHIFNVTYLDGNESVPLKYTHIDVWDEEFPDPTHSDVPVGIPQRWTRRGNAIEMIPLCATAYCDADIRLDGDFYAEDLTTNTTSPSDISGADQGLILYAVAQAWGAIGDEVKAKNMGR